MRHTRSGPRRSADGTAPKALSHPHDTGSIPAPQPLDGRARKLAAHALFAEIRALYLLRGRRALLSALLKNSTATADDVRLAVELPDGIDPVCMGAVPGALARCGIIEGAGFTESRRPDAHSRPITVWRLVDPTKAAKWLANNLDRPDPAAPDDTPLFAAGG